MWVVIPFILETIEGEALRSRTSDLWDSETNRAMAFRLTALGVVEYAFERFAEHGSNAKSRFQRRRIFSQLDRVHRLASEVDLFRQLLLRHLSVFEAQSSDFVADRAHVTHHAGIGRSGSRCARSRLSQERRARRSY